MSSSNSPCAACKCRRQKCTQECVFAPYFPPDLPQKFINVHKVFGASNVAKLLNELHAAQREDAVNSLAYEAEYRLQDPVYGCVGLISILQHKLKQVQHNLNNAKKELATFMGPAAMLPFFQHPGFIPPHANPEAAAMPYSMQQSLPPMMMGLPTGVAPGAAAPLMIHELLQQQQLYDAQQLAAAVATREQQQQEMYRTYDQQQQQSQPQLNGFDGVGFNPNPMTTASLSPSLALGSYEGVPYHQIPPQQQPLPEHSQSSQHQHQHHQFQIQSQKMFQKHQQPPQSQPQQMTQPALQSQTAQQLPHRAKSEEVAANFMPYATSLQRIISESNKSEGGPESEREIHECDSIGSRLGEASNMQFLANSTA